MAYRVIHVGTGGWGRSWCEHFLPSNIRDGLIEVVAAVDIDKKALANARTFLGLKKSQCFTDVNRAMDDVKADFCTIVVPPWEHERIVDAALAHNLHILSEKPIADTLEASCRVAEKVKRAGKKMGVTMSHRFSRDKTTLRRILRSGEYGPLDYLVMRFTCDCRKYASWGSAFRHEIPDALMIEGAVHHLDILADLAGAKCNSIYAQTWTPEWGEFKGDCQALVTMHMENGVRAFYEGAKANATGLNWWTHEYIRAENRGATHILSCQKLKRFVYVPSQERAFTPEEKGTRVPLDRQRKWANAWLIEKFVHWLDGGEPMETNVEDNLQSVALVFAAIASSRKNRPINVQHLLRKTRRAVRGTMKKEESA